VGTRGEHAAYVTTHASRRGCRGRIAPHLRAGPGRTRPRGAHRRGTPRRDEGP